MLDTIVRYLHDSLVPFKLSSYPSLERIPAAAQPIPRFAVLVDTRLVLAAGKLTIVCYPTNQSVDLSTLSNELGTSVIDVEETDLPEALQRAGAPPPPLGQLFGLPLVLDSSVTEHDCIVFQIFGDSDYVEIPYDDFALQEQPKVVSFSRAGELPPASIEPPAVSTH